MKTVYGEDIRKLRDERCLTQIYMAHALGISQSAYQKIESGESKISFERLTEIASVLKIPIDAFLNKAPKTENRVYAHAENHPSAGTKN